MNVRHLDHINMTVRDFDQTVDWYGRVFDFELVEEDLTEGVRWGVIRSGDAMLCIYEHPHRENTSIASKQQGPRSPRDGPLRSPHRRCRRVAWRPSEREKIHILYDGEITWPHSQELVHQRPHRLRNRGRAVVG